MSTIESIFVILESLDRLFLVDKLHERSVDHGHLLRHLVLDIDGVHSDVMLTTKINIVQQRFSSTRTSHLLS